MKFFPFHTPPPMAASLLPLSLAATNIARTSLRKSDLSMFVFLRSLLFLMVMLAVVPVHALTPPLPGDLEQYRQDGSLTQRQQRAQSLGNHKISARLLQESTQRLANARGVPVDTHPAPPLYWQGGLPASGNPKTLVLLIDFADYPHDAGSTVADVANKFFGNGIASDYPYESLRNFYQRSSYNALTISGNVLGWYRAAHPRNYYSDNFKYSQNGKIYDYGNEELAKEALNYYQAQGHNFSQYDNDGNGTIDALYVKWTGPDNGWSNFWWAHQSSFWYNRDYTVGGKKIGKYVWSWINNPRFDGASTYHPNVDIHETGHLLGLPDYYDYDDTVGPAGGVGSLDMMDGNWGDHNAFSKAMLGWITPTVIGSGSQTKVFSPSGTNPDAVQIMPSANGNLFAEFFMAQYRKRGNGNDPSDYPADGLLVWHVDATLNSAGNNFKFDNSYTSHKLLKLVQADGLEEIETTKLPDGGQANAGDFFLPPKSLNAGTTPNSSAYSGLPTGVTIDELGSPAATMSARLGFGGSASSYTLSVNSSEVSGVSIGSSSGHGGTTNYSKTGIAAGTSIALTAPAVVGAATFSSWNGCTSASGVACAVTMSASTSVTAIYSAGLQSQTITFGTAPSVTVGGTGTLSATGGASGQLVTFSSSTPTVCTVSSSTVFGVAVGTCTVAANQAGNGSYSAAPQVTQSFAVSASASSRYTKIANNGADLPASAVLGSGPTQWACTRDNTTGLTWEIKTADRGLRDRSNTYTNFDSHYGTQSQIDASSNSIGFANAVNSSSLCGASDWKMPSRDELFALLNLSYTPTIDLTFFPNTAASVFWSNLPSVLNSDSAWAVSFSNGNAYAGIRSLNGFVRLVRSGQFLGTFPLSVSASGTGSGNLASNTGGINCASTAGTTSGTCSASLTSGTVITLTATPATGSTFTGWGGACAGTSATCAVTMLAAKSVTASFTLNSVATYAISATANPAAGGTVICTPNPVNSGGNSVCTATPNAGYSFTRWSGDCAGATCSLSNVTSAKNVTANFVAEAGGLTPYTDNGDGTVNDPRTGLTWMRCAMGQTWTGSTCSGTDKTYTWTQAVALGGGATSFAGHNDWRLPNIRELQSIVDLSTASPVLHTGAFPNSQSEVFWSGSPDMADPARSAFAWVVYFDVGRTTFDFQSGYYHVRLVRNGQSLGLLNPARPTTDYVDPGNGTTTHTPSGLTWKRCAEGQIWSGSTCTGSASRYTWVAAQGLSSTFAGKSDWRLPTEEELLSLVDYTTNSPAINTTPFPLPLTPSDYWIFFWSSSSFAPDPADAWNVYFGNGDSGADFQSGSNHVRLVRSGQSLATFALTLSATGSGSGTLASNTGGINCASATGVTSGTCAASLASGVAITLTATPVTGSTFAGWGGACTGTATPCTLTMTAAKSVTASFNSTLASQTITLGATPSVSVGGTGTVSATASSGLPVTFTSLSTAVCTVSGSTVTGVAAGACTLAANQAGSSSVSPAPQVTLSFSITGLPPGPPTITSITAGSGSATIHFSAPSNAGGSTIASYSATCTAGGQATRKASGTTSPVTVKNLTGGVIYQCTLTATNSEGATSVASATLPVTPAPGKKSDMTPLLMLLLD